MKILLLTLLSFVIACATEDGNAPGPVGSANDTGSEASTMTTASSTTAGSATSADETGNDVCPEYGRYTCRGFVAGVYQNTGGGPFQFMNVGGVATNDFQECIEIDIEVPYYGADDSEWLYEQCRADCLDGYSWQWPAVVQVGAQTYELQASVCEFGDNWSNGVISDPEVTGFPTGGDCSAEGQDLMAPYEPSVECIEYAGPITDPDDCPSVSCESWNPESYITHLYTSRTKTHTTSMQRSFLQSIYSTGFDNLYGCDQGRFITDGTNPWSMQHIVTTDALYKMGFRNGDYHLTIRRNVTGATVYNLYDVTLDTVADVMDLLDAYSSFVITFRRPQSAAPGYATHTMYATTP